MIQVVNVEKADKQIRQVYPSKYFFKLVVSVWTVKFSVDVVFSQITLLTSRHRQDATCDSPSLSPSFHCVAGEHLSSVC
jgi:hypothetical protein